MSHLDGLVIYLVDPNFDSYLNLDLNWIGLLENPNHLKLEHLHIYNREIRLTLIMHVVHIRISIDPQTVIAWEDYIIRFE